MTAFKYRTNYDGTGTIDAASEDEALDTLWYKFPEAIQVFGIDDMDAPEDQELYVELQEEA